jgi:hypothetical protein
MVVCVEPERGFFFRINSEGKWQIPVPIARADHPGFLDHDSHIECGDPFELDDYVIEQSLARRGVIGRIDGKHAAAICAAVDRARHLREGDKLAIRRALGQAFG